MSKSINSSEHDESVENVIEVKSKDAEQNMWEEVAAIKVAANGLMADKRATKTVALSS